jgi:ribonuclease HII
VEPIVERDLREIGFNKIIGVDEAGRGSLCGAVVVASVMLAANHKIRGLNDSKLLSAKKREELVPLIHEMSLDVQISMAMSGMVDRLNVFNATKLCIKESLINFKVKPDIVVIDGKFTPFEGDYSLPYLHLTIPKGDTLSDNVAAASIIAKTYRDSMMIALDTDYPEYGFAKHKGYGTKEHMDAIMKYGPCPVHRRTFSVRGKKIGDL